MKEGDLVAGRYRLLRRIGAGAMGTVWAARHELIGRDLALKICAGRSRWGETPHTPRPGRSRRERASEAPRRGLGSRDARDLFLREVRIVGRLRHPNVVDIVDAGDTGDEDLYLAMELLDGESLAERIAAGPLAPGDALAVAAEIARGLAAAHAAGVVHRDLKPENIFLARGASGGVVPKLLDFGVSSVGAAGDELFGTPAYMSPEQALGESVDHRTDVWALGVVLYEMLTGELPFRAESYPALLPRIIEQPYPPLPASVPAEVRTVVAGCLAKDRGDRYPSADALLEAIDRALATLRGPDGEPSSDRAGLLVATGSPVTLAAPSAAVRAAAPRAPRVGLVLAILVIPLAIGVAAMAVRAGGSGRAAAQAAPAMGAGAPEPLVQAPPTAAVPVSPSTTASVTAPATAARPEGSAARDPRAPGPSKRSGATPSSKVTAVNSAGF